MLPSRNDINHFLIDNNRIYYLCYSFIEREDIMEIAKIISNKYNIHLSKDSLDVLQSILQRRTYKKDELILAEGQVSHYMYYVESGMVRQFYFKEGRDITEHFSCDGDIVACIESLFLGVPTNLGVEVLEPTVIYLLDYAKLKELSLNNIDLNKLLQVMLEYMLVISQKKADSWRFEASHERYERFCRDYPLAAQRASVAHIASYLLMSPETLSRVRSGLRLFS